jgi:hypothetical protein
MCESFKYIKRIIKNQNQVPFLGNGFQKQHNENDAIH